MRTACLSGRYLNVSEDSLFIRRVFKFHEDSLFIRRVFKFHEDSLFIRKVFKCQLGQPVSLEVI